MNADALQNRIGMEITQRQAAFFLMQLDWKAKRDAGEDTSILDRTIGEHRMTLEVLLAILRDEGDPVYLANLKATFPILETLAANSITAGTQAD